MGYGIKCTACGVLAYTKDLRANQMVCGYHVRVNSDERILMPVDNEESVSN